MKILERDWVWRGFQIRYSFLKPFHPDSENSPLLFIHGFGSSRNQWIKNLEYLGIHHPVYALDLVGFGASQKPAIAYKASLWAEQVYGFWSQFIGRPITLVGHSLGALVAATVATQFPHAVANIILLTLPATRQERISSPMSQKILGAIEKSVANPLVIRLVFYIIRQQRLIQSGLKQAYHQPAFVTDEVIHDVITPTYDRGAAQTLCRLTQAATTSTYSKDRKTLLSQLQQPTMVLWGECDRIIPIRQSYTLRKEFPSISWVDIPNAGHCLYDECAEIINERILRWVQKEHNQFHPTV